MPTDLTIILFAGFNEVVLPKGAQLVAIETDGYEMTLRIRSGSKTEMAYRLFYMAYNRNHTMTNYNQGVLRLLKTLQFSDGALSAVVYEVCSYDPS